jgi:ribosomal protein L32
MVEQIAVKNECQSKKTSKGRANQQRRYKDRLKVVSAGISGRNKD